MKQPEQIARAPWWQYFPWTFAAKASEASDEKWKPYPTLVKLAKIGYEAVKDGGRRIIYNVHPQSGKSELFSKWFPTWYFNAFPSNNIIFSTYADDYASNWGRKIRDEIRDNPTFNGLGTKELALKKDAQSKSEFETTEGGELIAAGTAGQVLGRGGNLVIVDDPYKNWTESQNDRVREDVEDWWEGTMQHRLLPGATVIVIHQRWHEDDFTAYLTDKDDENWEQYTFPAFAQVDSPEYDPRSPGEPFVPMRDGDFLRQKKRSMRTVVWNTVYMQEPADEEDLNELFTRKNIRENRVSPQEYPTLKRIAVGVDPPGDSDDNSSECGIVCGGLGVDDEFYSPLEDASIHGSPAQWGKTVVRCYDRNEADVVVGEVNNGGDMVEETVKQQAKELYRQDKRDTKHINFKQVNASRGKKTRAEPVSAIYENGRVHHVGKHETLEDQLVTWSPGDDSPDRMDAHVWEMRELMQNVSTTSTGSLYAR